MTYNTPYHDMQQNLSQSSGLAGTVGSVAWDALKWSTWRNPFFAGRVGTSGWDPNTSKYLGKYLNKALAPGANKYYSNSITKAYDIKRGKLTTLPERYMKGSHYRNKELISSYHHKWTPKYTGVSFKADISPKTGANTGIRGKIDKIVSLTGERTKSPRERWVQKRVKNDMAHSGGLSKMLLGDGANAASRHQAAAYIGGRALMAAQAPLLAWDLGKLAVKGFMSVSELGTRTVQRPTHVSGPGVQDSPVASNLRRRMIMDMHASQFGPRRIIGNEAGFLHT